VVRKELIGKDGTNIQELEQRAHVIKICTLDHLKYAHYGQRQRRGNKQEPPQSFINEEPSEDPNKVKLIIIGPKEKVPFAKMLIKSQVELIQQKRKFIQRQKVAKQEINNSQSQSMEMQNQSYYQQDQGQYDQSQHWDQYGTSQPMQSQRRRRKMQQHHTEQSQKNTKEFNYLTTKQEVNKTLIHNKSDPEFPSLTTSNDQTKKSADISWLEHDEAGMAEDEEEESQQIQMRDTHRQRGGGGHSGGRRQRERGQRGQFAHTQKTKQVWKAKSSSNQSSNQHQEATK